MKPLASLSHFFALLLFLSLSFAQPVPPAPGANFYSQAELDQILAPVALYPDPLLSQILMAATYPLEVVEAAHWSQANLDLSGEQALAAVEDQSWDVSVKSLVAFPQILRMMEEKISWTQKLGDAFLSQQAQVMDTVQSLRQRALAAGNLRSNELMQVEPQGQTIAIMPANPQQIYVPYYDPTVIYGTWWWPAYPPVYWAPWPGYYAPAGFASGFYWGVGITVGGGFFFGAFDWFHHHVNVDSRSDFYRRGTRPIHGRPIGIAAPPDVWHHDEVHRRGIPYREPSPPSGRMPPPAQTRGDFRGRALTAPDLRGAPLPRPQPVPGLRPNPGNTPNRGSDNRPNVEPRPPAFEGVGRGAEVRDFSIRGRSSSQDAAHGKPSQTRPAVGGGKAKQ